MLRIPLVSILLLVNLPQTAISRLKGPSILQKRVIS